MERVINGVAITFKVETTVSTNWDTLRSMQADVLSTRTDIHLVFAMETNVAFRTDAVLKVFIVCLVELQTVNAKLLEDRNVLGSLSADTIVLALQ